MLRTVSDAPTLWESVLPAELLGLPAELDKVDRLLDDERFVESYRQSFHVTLGLPSIPIETYLRLMFLKYRYRLGFEPLFREVADSISWQLFCRIPLGGRVPHLTTLMKITTRCGESAINDLNEALLARAVDAKVGSAAGSVDIRAAPGRLRREPQEGLASGKKTQASSHIRPSDKRGGL